MTLHHSKIAFSYLNQCLLTIFSLYSIIIIIIFFLIIIREEGVEGVEAVEGRNEILWK
jgi:hypothetical protein